jgi:hypothetical protein
MALKSLSFIAPPSDRSTTLAVSRWIEAQTGWSIRKFVKTARRFRTIEVQVGQHTITAADPLPDDLGQDSTPPAKPAKMRINLARPGTEKGDDGAMDQFEGRCWLDW